MDSLTKLQRDQVHAHIAELVKQLLRNNQLEFHGVQVKSNYNRHEGRSYGKMTIRYTQEDKS